MFENTKYLRFAAIVFKNLIKFWEFNQKQVTENQTYKPYLTTAWVGIKRVCSYSILSMYLYLQKNLLFVNKKSSI